MDPAKLGETRGALLKMVGIRGLEDPAAAEPAGNTVHMGGNHQLLPLAHPGHKLVAEDRRIVGKRARIFTSSTVWISMPIRTSGRPWASFRLRLLFSPAFWSQMAIKSSPRVASAKLHRLNKGVI